MIFVSDESNDSNVETQLKNTSCETSSGTIEDLMLDVAWRDLNSSSEEKRVLDTKANIILVANGVLLGLIINGLSAMDKLIAYFAVIVIILSSICCILALYLRPYSALGTMKTWTALKEKNLLKNIPQAKRNIMATIDAAAKKKREHSRKISYWIKFANILFIISLCVIAISLIIHYFNSVCICNFN